MDEMFRAAAMVTAFLICLGIFHYPCQLDCKLLDYPLDSTRIITIWVFAITHILFFQMCQVDCRLFWKWLVTPKFSQEKKLVFLGLRGLQQLGFWSFRALQSNLPSQPPWWPLGNLSMSSPVDPPSGRLPSLLIAWEVCHRSDPSLTLPLGLGENNQWRKWLKLVNASKGECPSPTWFPYPQSIIGIAPDSVHQALSHCYSVHSKLSAHCPRLYPYQNSILTLQDSLARILLHRVRGCNPCTLHINTLLNPTSNFGQSLHLWHLHP